MNSPIERSRVKILTPLPRVRQKNVDEEYKQYPDATKLFPGCNVFSKQLTPLVSESSKEQTASGSSVKIPKIVPVGIPASTFELQRICLPFLQLTHHHQTVWF